MKAPITGIDRLSLFRGVVIDTHAIIFALAYVLMGIGLVGAVVPLIPGPPLIWAGALVWAWVDGFDRVGWVTLAIMAVLAIVAMASDLIATTITGRQAGMGWRTIIAAIVGGLVGGAVLSILPVIGTLLGAILGALAGVMLVEHAQHQDWARAWQSAKVYILGFLIGRVFEVALCLLMIAVFIWGVFR